MIEPLCPLALIYGSSKVPKVPPENFIKICEGLRFKDDLGHGQMNHDDGLIRVNAFILTAPSPDRLFCYAGNWEIFVTQNWVKL